MTNDKPIDKIKTDLPQKEEYLLELLNNNYSPQTIKNYERDLTIFELFLHEHNIPFEKTDKSSISQFKGFLRRGAHLNGLKKIYALKQLAKRGISVESSLASSRRKTNGKDGLGSRSVNRILSSLRSFLSFMIDFDHKVPIPPEAIKLIKTERKISQVGELEELVKLIEAPETFEKKRNVKYRNRAMLELLFSTGMRISELINLNREHLNLAAETGKIKEGKVFIMGKGKKQRFVYLTPRAKRYLERYLGVRSDNLPALFIPYRGSRRVNKDPYSIRVSTNYLQSKIIEYRKRLGIVIPTSAHSLRHGFATYLAEQGANPAAIQHLLGHESLQTTTRYVHASDKFAEKAHTEHHPLKGKGE